MQLCLLLEMGEISPCTIALLHLNKTSSVLEFADFDVVEQYQGRAKMAITKSGPTKLGYL